MNNRSDCWWSFESSIIDIDLPEKFTFPFYYKPHPLALKAVNELQAYLEQTDFKHNFGLDERTRDVIGKMFGVLIVQNADGQLGYLAAFSGKLGNSNYHKKFVPPVFDILREDGFFKQKEIRINAINARIEALEQDTRYQWYQADLTATIALSEKHLSAKRKQLKFAKNARKKCRSEAQATYTPKAFEELKEALKEESLMQQYFYKRLVKRWKLRLQPLEERVAMYKDEIIALKQERKQKSAALQRELFEQYTFLNKDHIDKSLLAIFSDTVVPPAGAGECAAPKLLQYAFLNNFKIIAMAEFWWGASPKSAIRKHQHFYPACRGKCAPILEHMLEGIEMDDNPLLENLGENTQIETVYEDEHLVVVHKPAELLSVPGKNIEDSVYTRMQAKYPAATGPLIVHRLDMSTSGLLLIAKNKEIHKALQQQFIKRTVKKRYIALLEGTVEDDIGFIDLPLRVDLDDRPRQLVCYEYGKRAQTKWKVIERKNNQTRVYFYPITGRTHQLRVHAAHTLGLNSPIVGDDLYGNRSQRLCLHAEWLEFWHPALDKKMSLKVPPNF